MINTINFNQIRNSEHIQLNKAILHVCETYNPETLHIKPQYDALKEANDSMETIFVTARGNVLTKNIISEDDKRDRLIIGFTETVTGYTKHFDANKIPAAELLASHIKKYGSSIANLNYVAETAIIFDLIDGIENNAELTAAAELLGISDWLGEIKVSNTEFNRLYDLRASKEAGKSKLNLKELRTEAVNRYRDLVKYLQAASIMYPSDIYETVTDEINEYIDKYNNLRRKLNSEEDEGEE